MQLVVLLVQLVAFPSSYLLYLANLPVPWVPRELTNYLTVRRWTVPHHQVDFTVPIAHRTERRRAFRPQSPRLLFGPSHCPVAFTTTPPPIMDEDVAQFMAITGVDNERVARGYLDISSNDQMQAIQLFFESPELAASFTGNTNTTAPQSSSAAAPAQSSRGSRRAFTGREDAQGVITIDSDDEDDDVDMLAADDNDDDDDGVAAVARAAQEEDDAAMARRLQEEMYGQGASQDEVRAPMSRTTETLVGPDPSWGLDDDREAAILEQLRRRRQPPSKLATKVASRSRALY